MLASENPHDIHLTDKVNHYELIVLALATLASYVVLDLGTGLPPFVDKILPLCTDRIVVTEGTPSSITLTKLMIEEIAKLGIDPAGINVVLNNRVRSEAQMPWTEVQESLGHSITATITPAPEMFTGSRAHAYACRPFPIDQPHLAADPESCRSDPGARESQMKSSPTSVQDAIEFTAELLRKAQRAVVLTGAGLSTPSGIPDFRSEGTGLWSHDEPLEVASLNTFRTRSRKILCLVPTPGESNLRCKTEPGTPCTGPA